MKNSSKLFQNQLYNDTSEEKLKQLNKYEDLLDVFVHISILRLPTVYTIINMTLMIWLVQTIFTSWNSETIPKSLYYFAPLLQNRPMVKLESTQQTRCKQGWEEVILKTFPFITNQSIHHSNLTKWKQNQRLCAIYSNQTSNFTKTQCSSSLVYCSGICVDNQQNCPITSIRKINPIQIVMPHQQTIYQTKDQFYRFVISRTNRNGYIIGISAQYQERCANQFKYYETYDNFQQYWASTKDCQNEGGLSSQFYHSFDAANTSDFFLNNGIWTEKINKLLSGSQTDLGYLNNINYKNGSECANIKNLTDLLPSKLLNSATSSFYEKNLLIISFVLFTICWIWLVAAYCCQGPLIYKNAVVIILAVIEFITITFIYSRNTNLLELQKLIQAISNCIDSPMNVFQSWNIGSLNKTPLISIIFTCTCFLLIQMVCYFLNFCIYVAYREVQDNRISVNGAHTSTRIQKI